jgi:hypothetical protein
LQKHNDVEDESKGRLDLKINLESLEEKVKLEDFSDVVYSSTLSGPPQKRRRLQLEVVVPTLDLVMKRRASEMTGDYVKTLQKMKNVSSLLFFSVPSN